MNDFVTWIGQAKETLETLAIVVGLSFNAFTIWENTRERKISNLLSIADSHQKLWLQANAIKGRNEIKGMGTLKKGCLRGVE